MIKVNFVLVNILIILLCISQPGIACTSPITESSFFSADSVFIGKVTKVAASQAATVDLVSYKEGKLLNKSDWYWEKFLYKILNVIMEVNETFKGIPSKTVDVSTGVFDDYRKENTVPYKVGESFLVYAYKRRPLISYFEHILIGKQKTEVIAEADKFNELLPLFVTGLCSGTWRIKHSNYGEDEIKKIRSIAKNGLPKLPKGVMQPPPNLPTRILY